MKRAEQDKQPEKSRKAHIPKPPDGEQLLLPLKNTMARENQSGIQGSTKGFDNKAGKQGRPGHEGRQ